MAATPHSLDYRMPAEWEPQQATWLIWPHNRDTWPGHFEPVPAAYARLVAEISTAQRAEVIIQNSEAADECHRLIAAAGGKLDAVGFHELATNDSWVRDCGPTFVVRRDQGRFESALVGWGYNAWGGKYPPWDKDIQVPRRLSERLGLELFEPGIILEGGSIDVNGRGTLLTTEQCLLNPNRNPELSREQIEAALRDYLGATNVIWLGEGIEGDDTDGHIDDITRFVAPDTVVTVVEDDVSDPNHQRLLDNLDRLRNATDEAGRSLQVVTLPMPEPAYCDGQRLPASYANFIIINRKVIVPIFDGPRDGEALGILRSVFPGRQVVGLRANELAWGLGTFHCLTQQQPGS